MLVKYFGGATSFPRQNQNDFPDLNAILIVVETRVRLQLMRSYFAAESGNFQVGKKS